MTTASSDISADISAWFSGRLPAEWTQHGPPTVVVDREEITVTLEIAAPDLADDTTDTARAEAAAGRIAGFRDDTREQRMSIAREAEHRFERKVAWGVRTDGHAALFTHIAVPAMTRLRQPERQVLDTLIAAGVAQVEGRRARLVRQAGRPAHRRLAGRASVRDRRCRADQGRGACRLIQPNPGRTTVRCRSSRVPASRRTPSDLPPHRWT